MRASRRGLGRLAFGLLVAALAVALGTGAVTPRAVLAHAVDAATLSLTELGPGRFRVKWQANSAALQADVKSPATFPSACRLTGDELDCGPAGLIGALAFPWLEGSLTHLLVDVSWQNGAHILRVLTASSPPLVLYGAPTAGGWSTLRPIVVDYTRLGVAHILGGFDHLLFVVALTLLVRGRRALLATITAFTVAHSFSLAATVLGLVELPSAPVEACIALSILLVCAECLSPAPSLTHRAPWLVAFSFGLLHGLGFASALLEVGLPAQHVPLALLFFNVGVELGQLATIAVVGVVAALVRLVAARAPALGPELVPRLRVLVIYVMGALASFWSLDRVAAVFGR